MSSSLLPKERPRSSAVRATLERGEVSAKSLLPSTPNLTRSTEAGAQVVWNQTATAPSFLPPGLTSSSSSLSSLIVRAGAVSVIKGECSIGTLNFSAAALCTCCDRSSICRDRPETGGSG